MVTESVAKIAFLAPLTGAESVVGVPMMQAVALAVAEANARFEFPFSVELLALDDEANPLKARQLAESLTRDRAVVGVVGHKNSGPSAAAGAVYAAAGLAQITPSSTNSDLARQGWPTFFRICADNDRQATAAARYAQESLGVRRLAVIHDGTDYGLPLAETFASAAVDGGAEVALLERVALGQREFGATVARIEAVAPDLVYFGLTEIESAYLTRDLRRAGVESLLFGADGGRQSPFPRLAGKAAEGVYETYAGVEPETLAFVQACESRYGHCPIFGPEAYDAASLLLEALRRAGAVDRRAVLAELQTLDGFEGATGALAFEANGNRRDARVTIWRVVDGEMRLLL
ncbi:MAG: branched-chain amino acid ABC transporter substrate-binding protein [Chloroflexota bacterium]